MADGAGKVQLNRRGVDFYNQAVSLLDTDKQLAYKLFVSAVDVEPRIYQAWYAIGTTNHEHGLTHGAIAAFRRCLELDPNNGAVWTNLGHTLYSVGRLDEAREATKRALAVDDKLAMAWLNMSLIQSIEGNLDGALKSAKLAFELDPAPATEMGIAFAYLHMRDLKRGLRHFEAKLPHKLTNHLNFPYPRWTGEDLSEATLFVMADQGMGDTLDYLRFIPMVAAKCDRVVMQIQGEMMRLAGIMLSDIPNIQIGPINAPFPDADFWVPITSIPVALDLSSDAIELAPQLAIPKWDQPQGFSEWKAPNRKLHIGIAWAGATGNDIDRYRSMDLENFLEFAKVPGVQLYSLQVGARSQDAHTMGCAPVVKDLTIYLRDVADTVGFLREFDLVIAVESFLPHLCNAVGKEVWIPYGFLGGDYRIGRKGTRTIWHHHSKVFYQDRRCQWQPVMDEIVEALKRRIANG